MPGNVRNKIIGLVRRYEQRQDRLISRTLQAMLSIMSAKGTEAAFLFAHRRLISDKFLPKDIRDTIRDMASDVVSRSRETLTQAINESFALSKEKNDQIEKTAAGGRRVPPQARTQVAAAATPKGTITAVDKFLERRDQGLSLSDRIWKMGDSFQQVITDSVYQGLQQGTAARTLAKQIRSSLRVNAFQTSPGRGIYKSPMQNAMRVTRNEINLANAAADHDRWQQIDTIIGYEVRLSNRHPVYDMCDQLAGEYPKTFKFSMWHVNCLCIAIPKLADQQTRDAIMDFKLGLIDTKPDIKQITEIPGPAKKWIRDNADRVEGWKNKPYWWKNNNSVVKDVVGTPVPKPAPAPAPKPAPVQVPGGEKISSQFTKISPSLKSQVNHTLHSIDAVHGDGKLDDIPFLTSRSEKHNAQFWFTGRGKADKITVSGIAKAPELSLAHELGHYLDLHSIGSAGNFASEFNGSATNAVVKIAEKSEAIKHIKESLAKGYMTIGENKYFIDARQRKHLRYLLDPKEIWARSYAQFIAKKSGSEKMIAGVAMRVERKKLLGYSDHWTDDDFKQISDAIEKMMMNLGWIINQ